MKIQVEIEGVNYAADLGNPHEIGIQLQDGESNPNCFYADRPSIRAFQAGEFIGDIQKGSPVNFKNVFFNPHGNGTHTECSGHVKDNGLKVGDLLKKFFFLCHLITVEPESKDGDWVIYEDKLPANALTPGIQALVVRTLPNSPDKKLLNYSGSNPPYFDPGFMLELNRAGICHFLTDLPSVDREQDGGKLLSHFAFWNNSFNDRTRCTITELVYVPDYLEDGIYLLEMQIMNLGLDAAPSRPVLYELI